VGLLVGSFLNVVIYRVPRGMSIVRPPSHCPTCDTELSGLDNVPLLSWLFLRGRCRYCRTPISVRYPIVELLTGVCFGLTALCLQSFSPLPSLVIAIAALIAATAIDLDSLPIPWSVDVAAWVGAGSLVIVAGAIDEISRIGWAALGAVAAGGAVVVAWRAEKTLRRACAVAAAGWASSWLWPPGGLVLAAVALAVAAALAIAARSQRSTVDSAPFGLPPGASSSQDAIGVVRAGALALVMVGGFALLLASAAVGSPL
jgi:leader peptidase (prepilin peptidase)/N-methyltransferase